MTAPKQRASMNPPRQLHDLGQSLWLDNITRGLLASGTLARYIEDFAITGLTSNPHIIDIATKESDAYDDEISVKSRAGQSVESMSFEQAMYDMTRAADLL